MRLSSYLFVVLVGACSKEIVPPPMLSPMGAPELIGGYRPTIYDYCTVWRLQSGLEIERCVGAASREKEQ